MVHVLGPDGSFAEHSLDCRGRRMQVPWFEDAVPPDRGGDIYAQVDDVLGELE